MNSGSGHVHKRDLTAKVGSSASVKALIRTELPDIMFEEAKRFKEEAKKVRGANPDQLGVDLRSSLISIVLTAGALEGYINRYCLASSNLNEHQKQEWAGPGERKSLTKKWANVAELVTGKSFEQDKEPFVGLKRLKEARDYILHSKVKFHKPVTGHSETHDKVNANIAEDVCRTAMELVVKLHSFAGDTPPDAWKSP